MPTAEQLNKRRQELFRADAATAPKDVYGNPDFASQAQMRRAQAAQNKEAAKNPPPAPGSIAEQQRGGAGGGLDLAGLFKSLGGAGGGGVSFSGGQVGGSSGGTTPGADFTSTVQEDPRITGWSDAVLKRATNPGESTGHAINVAGSAIRDASEGRKKALRAGAASRGALAGSTIPQIGEAALGAQEGRDINAAATNISLGREKDADQLLLGAGDAAKAPGQQKMAAQDQNRMQWQAVEQNKRAQEASELQAYLGKLDVIGKFANLASF